MELLSSNGLSTQWQYMFTTGDLQTRRKTNMKLMYKLILSINVWRSSVIQMEIPLYSPLSQSFKLRTNKELFNHLFTKINMMILTNHSFNENNLKSIKIKFIFLFTLIIIFF